MNCRLSRRELAAAVVVNRLRRELHLRRIAGENAARSALNRLTKNHYNNMFGDLARDATRAQIARDVLDIRKRIYGLKPDQKSKQIYNLARLRSLRRFAAYFYK